MTTETTMRFDDSRFGIGLALLALFTGIAMPVGVTAQQTETAARSDTAAQQNAVTAAQQNAVTAAAPLTRAHLDELRTMLERHMNQERGRLEGLQRQVDVVTLYTRLADLAWVDELRFFGPPLAEEEEPRPITGLFFVPKRTDGPDRGSLLIWQRGEDALEIESWSDVPELRALLERGVTVVAPTHEGGPDERLEAVPDYALRRFPFLDRSRVEWRAPR